MVDPITLEVIQERLISIVREMRATLARDARGLADEGYTIERADGFDLFPNTPHVEVVVVFTRN